MSSINQTKPNQEVEFVDKKENRKEEFLFNLFSAGIEAKEYMSTLSRKD